MLEQIPVPGVPNDERERRKAWLNLPKKARVAIRRMHEEWGHMPVQVMIQILKLAKSPKEYIDAAMKLKCKACDMTKPNPIRSKASAPHLNYAFNHTLGIDVFDLHDYDGVCWLFLNIVCMGTDFQIVCFLCKGPGSPSSKLCGHTFMMQWVSWAGWPKQVVVDRGTHNRGYFSRMLGAHGICNPYYRI